MDEKAFTLIEMLIVLMVISVLLLIVIPNITKHNGMINNKGCEAFVNTVQAQVKAYEMEHNKIPTIQELINEKYIKSAQCPNGRKIQISSDGEVSESGA
ncbi:competence type IV pilus major pilin ComGC [Parageobacillus thermoglucosidasius]|mgnify:FL=1|uniref:ComG operon protein 3 n=1 Tax=Parageobacillus thermoglucosidasius TaxID=1426 RepID=A0AB38QY08_PARTM|nr:competence type IV pilus major pilin ComGC [Parageobacillus thermoglucosidasius]UOE75372.1 prepilin-type N-terminal cleavage/methylation domain-containing protein [Parageobacillus thermoglucosidasius]GCD81858.1 competence protein ComG [Parageobacillus thermoglucosidasius]